MISLTPQHGASHCALLAFILLTAVACDRTGEPTPENSIPVKLAPRGPETSGAPEVSNSPKPEAKRQLSEACQNVLDHSTTAYTEGNVEQMLEVANACVESGSLVGRSREFVSKTFPPPIIVASEERESSQNYYLGNWEGSSEPVKLVFCFDQGSRVTAVRAGHGHRDLACL